MSLDELGYNHELEDYRKENNIEGFEVGRIFSEHKERYGIKTSDNEFDAEIIGNLRFSAQSRYDFPAVGDWVAFMEYDDGKALIHAIYPRKTIIERQAIGKHGEKQIIATNIDSVFIVQAVDRDFNINRIERYLTICNTAKVSSIIILNKIDLVSEAELSSLVSRLKNRIENIPIVAISNETKEGFEMFNSLMEAGKTFCLLGSSGVGKSTIMNQLSNKSMMKTGSISKSSDRGKHVTSHRELTVLENGAILIDNPGMREVGIADAGAGLDITFETIYNLSPYCRFKDCTHTQEKECAVITAVENGEIDGETYENYLKMEREKEHFESTVSEKRKKDKDLGKLIKQAKKSKNLNKF
jgi:ribosome biogenesis GTPase